MLKNTQVTSYGTIFPATSNEQEQKLKELVSEISIKNLANYVENEKSDIYEKLEKLLSQQKQLTDDQRNQICANLLAIIGKFHANQKKKIQEKLLFIHESVTALMLSSKQLAPQSR